VFLGARQEQAGSQYAGEEHHGTGLRRDALSMVVQVNCGAVGFGGQRLSEGGAGLGRCAGGL
jgi:hypothetical protein